MHQEMTPLLCPATDPSCKTRLTFEPATQEDIADQDSANEGHPAMYHCITQISASIDAVCIGYDGKVTRWECGSTISFKTNIRSFRCPEDAAYAEQCLVKAAAMWRGAGVKFKRVPFNEPAVFTLVYKHSPNTKNKGKNKKKNKRKTRGKNKGKKESVLARAFFPFAEPEDCKIFVYALSFQYREFMTNIFAHELGHVLGLRHEACWVWESPGKLLRQLNPSSIMVAFNHPSRMKVDEEDIMGVQELYQLEGMLNKWWPIEVVKPRYI